MRSLGLALLLLVLSAATVCAQERSGWPEEGFLLNLRLGSAEFSRLRVWEPRQGEWRPRRPDDFDPASPKILILHLWAEYCEPCRREFPWLKRMARQLHADSQGEVVFLLISEGNRLDAMRDFMVQNAEQMPTGPSYHDTGEALADLIRANVPSGNVLLPTTLILDAEHVVRYAIVGSLLSRRLELVSAVARLQHLRQPHHHSSSSGLLKP